MISKFIILWIFLSLGAGAWLFIFGAPEKKTIKTIIQRVVISGIVGIVIIAALMILNNVQGI